MKNFQLLFKTIIILFIFIFTIQAKAIMLIKHSLTASENENSLSYELAVLKLILDKSKDKYGDYQLVKSIKMSQTRAFHELSQKNPEVNVIATMTSIEREQKANPIRICLFKGLLGVRIPIVLKSEKERIEKTTTLLSLQKLTAGQVFDWPDTTILEGNKIVVQKTTSYPGLLPMLAAKRFDIFPLGALEVYPIAKEHEAKYGLTVIEKWAIAYPTGYYFFVSKKDKILEARLNYGFMNAIKDGSFNKIFEIYNNKYLQIANLEKRKIFYLKNPILPKTTLFNDQSLWYPLIWKGFSVISKVK